MTINFNFKKYLKYFLLGILCYILLHSFSSAKAWSNLDSQYIVNYTNSDNSNIADFLIKGNVDNLDSYLKVNEFSDDFSVFYNNVKNYVANYLNYSSFEEFEEDYYYIADFWLSLSGRGSIDLSFFYCEKSNANASLFNLSMATTIRSSSTPTINTSQTYYTQFAAIYRTGSIRFYEYFDNLDSSSFTQVTNNTFTQRIFECNSSSSYCQVTGYNSNSKVLSINFTNEGAHFLHYVDSNKNQLDLFFAKVNALLGGYDYVFQKSILSNNLNEVYNLVEPIATNVLTRTVVEKPNVQELSSSSLGVNYNTIANILGGYDDNDTYKVLCSSVGNRPYVNNVCYLYGNDILDKSNANYSNEIQFLNLSNDNIDFSEPYYIISFRLYTPYNLNILDAYYKTNIYGNEILPFNIVSTQVVDYSLYRDYVVVVETTSSGTQNLTELGFIFSDLSSFVSSIPNDYSFGVYNTVKISSYSQQPTSTDIENEIKNNPLSSISNNDNSSFFSNFKINDRGLSQFILLPLNYISNYKNTTCSSISLPIPHLSNFSLPCVSSFMNSNVPTIWTLYKLLINGFIIYRIIISLFSDLKNIYKPDNDRIEVLDL